MQTDVPVALAEAEGLYPALHPVVGSKLCRDAPGDRAGNAPQDRQKDIMKFINHQRRIAGPGGHQRPDLTDDLKPRPEHLLTLMNLRENLDRASMRTPAGRSGIFR